MANISLENLPLTDLHALLCLYFGGEYWSEHNGHVFSHHMPEANNHVVSTSSVRAWVKLGFVEEMPATSPDGGQGLCVRITEKGAAALRGWPKFSKVTV